MASTPDSDYSDDMMGANPEDVDGRVMLEDDEDRIPEEQLLKYTKPDSPLPPVSGASPTTKAATTAAVTSRLPSQTSSSVAAPPPSPHSTRRSRTPDHIHAQES